MGACGTVEGGNQVGAGDQRDALGVGVAAGVGTVDGIFTNQDDAARAQWCLEGEVGQEGFGRDDGTALQLVEGNITMDDGDEAMVQGLCDGAGLPGDDLAASGLERGRGL